jgi:putative Mn2+ efflux pump MntP
LRERAVAIGAATVVDMVGRVIGRAHCFRTRRFSANLQRFLGGVIFVPLYLRQ